jgi:hypothetical protein
MVSEPVPRELRKTALMLNPDVVATKNIVRIDFVDFSATAIVRSLHENYCPPRPVHAARSTSNPVWCKKTESLLSGRFTIVEIQHTAKPTV